METRKAGELYTRIATNYLCYFVGADLEKMPSGPQEILNSGDFDKIEQYAASCTRGNGIRYDIERIIQAIFSDFMQNTPEERDQYLQYVLFGASRPNELNPVACGGINSFGEMAFAVLNTAHNGWMNRNASWFDKEDFVDSRYRFLPIEMIGWRAVHPNYGIFFEIFKDIGFYSAGTSYLGALIDKNPVILTQIVKRTYLCKSGSFFRKVFFDYYSPQSRDFLHDYIGNRGWQHYPEVPPNVQRALCDFKVADEIAKQLKEIWQESEDDTGEW